MRYFTWNTIWDDGSEYGTTPEPSVITGYLEGGFEYQGTSIVGYGSDDVDITGLEKWSVIEITQNQALEYAQILNSKCFILNGKITAPKIEIL
jgi:hypothetical protein